MLEERFRHAQKMEAIGQLAGGVAHDFNNLLTVINACSEVLLAEIAATDEGREAVAAIQDASERAARLTGQLLAFGRKAMTQPRVLDLNELIDSIGSLFRRLIGEDVALITRLDPTLSRVRMDSAQVEQVIVNLVVNAREASSSKPQERSPSKVELGSGRRSLSCFRPWQNQRSRPRQT
jgi:two-component system cell cycle sensor histidine kinase/response regulator CckA